MAMTINQFLSTTSPTNSSLYMSIDSAYNDLKTCAALAQAHNCLEETQLYRIIIESLNMENAKDILHNYAVESDEWSEICLIDENEKVSSVPCHNINITRFLL